MVHLLFIVGFLHFKICKANKTDARERTETKIEEERQCQAENKEHRYFRGTFFSFCSFRHLFRLLLFNFGYLFRVVSCLFFFLFASIVKTAGLRFYFEEIQCILYIPIEYTWTCSLSLGHVIYCEWLTYVQAHTQTLIRFAQCSRSK